MKLANVTVIIPNYNRTALLERALKSISLQTATPNEVIIVDDFSDDSSYKEILSIANSYKSKIQIKILRNDKNRGANYSRNIGIKEASSKYVAFLDSDDLWMPKKLEIQMACIEEAKKKSNLPILSATGRYRINGSGELIAKQFGGRVLSGQKIRQSNFIGTLSSVVVETWIARHIHGFDETLAACQDWDFFIRLSDYVTYVGVPDPLCLYADHDEERITLNNKKRLKAHFRIYKTHIKGSAPNFGADAEFYRNLAEDYQLLGWSKHAAKFYVKYIRLTKVKRSPAYKFVPVFFWTIYYSNRVPKSIKDERYSRYRRLLEKLTSDPSKKTALDEDILLIRRLAN